MTEVINFIKRVIDRLGFKREKFIDDKVPNSFTNIRIIPFFGDAQSELVLSSLLLHRMFRQDYVILLSWPGHSGLYETVNEYWTIDDQTALSDLYRTVKGFDNSKSDIYEKMLLRYFEKVTPIQDFFNAYYEQGFTSKYFKDFADIEYMLPSIPSANMSWGRQPSPEGMNVVLKPTKYVDRCHQGMPTRMVVEDRFWRILVESLINDGIRPILLQDYSTHDLSDLGIGCYYVTDNNIMAILAVMRSCDCVLDLFNGLSRYAIMARCPYFCCDERQRYFQTKDYVIDDMCGKGIAKEFMYSFAPVNSNDSYKHLVKGITNRLKEFVRNVDRSTLPSSVRSVKQLSYESVRKRDIQRIGARFISVPKLEE